MSVNKMAILIIGGALLIVGSIWAFVESRGIDPRLEKENYTIVKSWKMPDALEEISGISWMEGTRIACVQDEDGIIFMYDLVTSKIIKQIKFGDSDDYEALAVMDSTVFIANSEGTIFEISDYLGTNMKVLKHDTFFNGKNNIEALTVDPKHNRLLLTTRGDDPKSKTERGIYAFNLETRQMETKPVYTISQEDPIFYENEPGKKKRKIFRASDIGVHPKNGNIFLLQANPPLLLELDASAKPIKIYYLNPEKFVQPEGLTFNPAGDLYISNEGRNGTANILQIELKK